MTRLRLLSLLCALLQLLVAAAEELPKSDSTRRYGWRIGIEQVDVVGSRPLKAIGTQQSQIDSTLLHEQIASQMADVLKFGTSVYVKEYGRATLSTVAFRGTSPSHTQVTWNGMKLNSPMLGMVDFSMIPSYFIDDAQLLHGTSSVTQTGGGLGGAVILATRPTQTQGVELQAVQGIGMYRTFDEFARLTYGNSRWQGSTRVVYARSENDFLYTNFKKKENIYNSDGEITGQYYPRERNRSGEFADLHLLQELYYNRGDGNRFGLSAWYIDSERGVPMLNVDYRDAVGYSNRQREQTLRSVLSWDHLRSNWKTSVKAGYIQTWLGYDYKRDKGNGSWEQMIRSRSRVHTLFAQAEAEYALGCKWLFAATLSANQHFVTSSDKRVAAASNSEQESAAKWVDVGYQERRIELEGAVTVKWRPTEALGLSAVVREQLYGKDWTPPIPALFADVVLSKRGNIIAKGSVSRNFRFPTLNDLYFMPGGNPDLRTERGFTYDGGVEFTVGRRERYKLHGEATWFDSSIKDWIVWLPTVKGFWSPLNIKQVHAYGVELKGDFDWQFAPKWQLTLHGNFSWTPSINQGDASSWADEALGKQLVYVPEFSAAWNALLRYSTWSLGYKWCYYSERFTSSSNETKTKIGRVSPYFMSDATLEKQFRTRWSDFGVKLLVKNLFDEAYESVLQRPMPGINFEIFLEIKPKW